MNKDKQGNFSQDLEPDTITVDGHTYKLSEESEQFRKMAHRLLHVRKMLVDRQRDLSALTFTRDVLKIGLLQSKGETGSGTAEVTLPETLSFEDAE